MKNIQIENQYQKGMSLISLMIGLFISMVCILASLTLYKNLIYVSADAKIDSLHDGQLAAALLTTQLEIQSAGYRITDAGVDDVVTRDNSGTLELLWRYSDGAASFECRGLMESAETVAGINYRVLKLVKATSGCDENSALIGMAWGDVATLGRWPVRDNLVTYMTGRTSMLAVDIDTATCSPYGALNYGASAADEHLLVTITAPLSSRVNAGVAEAMTSFKYCLLNT